MYNGCRDYARDFVNWRNRKESITGINKNFPDPR